MDLKSLEIFIYVAEQNSFTKAAQKLGYTQAAVSFQIKQLEQSLGVMLFERINHSIKLTPKGKELLQIAHQILDLSDDMIKRAKSEENEIKGNVTIAMADSLCHWLFWDNYSNFHNKFPDVSLKIYSGTTDEMLRLAKQNDVDFIFTLEKHLYDSNYITVKEHPVSIHFVASSKNNKLDNRVYSLSDIMNERFILTEKGMSYREPLDERLARVSCEITPAFEIGDTDLICRLVEQNMGISYLPDLVTKPFVDKGKIKYINVGDVSSDIWIQMLYHRNKVITPTIQAVMDYLCKCL
ncbi:LysR family transcriptional regulator [uncultured Eubacterium sp.]|uniref:LysR family transcriptional regulator n=1 Tax=uncultured Eubacterium sp. TaxID=165185 RepID=UPI0028059365|nr:LysR family transcriptional regulator [uncultured Eubacterium sp.]